MNKLYDLKDAAAYAVSRGLMALILLAGACQIFGAVAGFFSGFGHPFSELHHELIGGILRGLECFFLAPMPMLLAVALKDVTVGVMDKGPAETADALAQLTAYKRVIIGLMTTALATGLIEGVFNRETMVHPAGWLMVGAQVIVLAVLCAYLILLNRPGR